MPPTIDEWTLNFAVPNGIDSRIIGFLNFEPSALYRVDFKDNQKFCTPRGWERVNELIKDIKDYKVLSLITQTAIGEGTATKFVAFCKIQEKLNLEDYIKNPKKIENIKEPDVKYFLVSALAERYRDKKIRLPTILDASRVLEKIKSQEFTALLWKLCLGYTAKDKRFRKEFLDSENTDDLAERFKKLVVGE